MRFFLLALLFLLAVSWTQASVVRTPTHVTKEAVTEFVGRDLSNLDVYETFTALYESLYSWVERELEELDLSEEDASSFFASDYPYWNFLPQHLGNVAPKRAPYTLSAKCFDYLVSAEWKDDTKRSLEVTLSAKSKQNHHPSKGRCTDYLVLESGTSFLTQHVSEEGEMTFDWALPEDALDSEQWDLATKGVRVNHFLHPPSVSMLNVFKTLSLFVPEFTSNPPQYFFELNRQFLESYSDFSYPPQDPSLNVDLKEEDINSGDVFALIRFNGLSTTLCWGMGSTSSHTTAALRMGGQLYVVESTMANAYWPVDGIQKTPWETWVQRVRDDGYSVVHLPLKQEYAEKFNEQAAIDFFLEAEGTKYGFSNILFDWIDSLQDNYPCLPPDYNSNCLKWEVFETFALMFDRALPTMGSIFVGQAMQNRLNSDKARFADLVFEGYLQGYESVELFKLPELDSYRYTTTRYDDIIEGGLANVCSAFACNILKHGGIFDGLEINCADHSDYDVFALTIFEEELQQVAGEYKFTVNEHGTKDMMNRQGERCVTISPHYPGREVC